MPDVRTGCRGEGGDGADEGIVCPAYGIGTAGSMEQMP